MFIDEKLDPLIVSDKGGFEADGYEDIIYDVLFSLTDGPLEPPEDSETICSADQNTIIFMQDNVSCHKSIYSMCHVKWITLQFYSLKINFCDLIIFST